jgi:hypothetical protein
MPGENRIGLGHCRDFFQGLPAQLLPQDSKGAAIAIRQLHSIVDLLAQNAILGDQVSIAQPDLFIDRRSDRSEQFLPVHPSLTSAKKASVADQYGRRRNEIQGEAPIVAEA